MQDNIETEYNGDPIFEVIKSVALPDQVLYRRALIFVFLQPFSPELETAFLSGNMHLATLVLKNSITDRIVEVVNSHPEIDLPLFGNYVTQVIRGINVLAFSDTDIPDTAKFIIADFSIENIENEIFINKSLQDHPDVGSFVNFFRTQKERYHNSNTGLSLLDSLKSLTKDTPNNDYIFDYKIISEIDNLLRPDFISEDSPSLHSYLEIEKWKTKNPEINWKKKQATLLYLFYKLNGWNREIPGGKLDVLISHAFKINGETVKATNISKALSKITDAYTSSETKLIDNMLKSAGA